MAIGGLVRLSPRPGAEAELWERALDMARSVNAEPGNAVTLVLRDPASPGDVVMLELFDDEAAIAAHRTAPHTVERGPAIHALLREPMAMQRFETVDFAAPAAVPAPGPR